MISSFGMEGRKEGETKEDRDAFESVRKNSPHQLRKKRKPSKEKGG